MISHRTTPEILAAMLAFTAEQTLAFNERIAPMFVGVTANDEHMPIITELPGDSDAKDQVLANVRDFFEEHQVRMYGMIAEAWTTELMPGETLANYLAPSNPNIVKRNNRKEVVNILVCDNHGCLIGDMYEIVRDTDGKPSLGTKLSVGATTSGRFCNLLCE